MKDRINDTFQLAKDNDKHCLIGYLTAGDPMLRDTVKKSLEILSAGVDILELGVPYSDPLADGEFLQGAAKRAVDSEITPKKVFEMARMIRNRREEPIVLLVYFNSILSHGIQEFIDDCLVSGIDGLVVPDLPLEERDELMKVISTSNTSDSNHHISLIPLVSEYSGNRLNSILKDATGFVYCTAYAGVTGKEEKMNKDFNNYVENVKKTTELPIAVGFGISNKEDIEYYSKYCDGIIVGTALMKKAIHDEANLASYIEDELR